MKLTKLKIREGGRLIKEDEYSTFIIIDFSIYTLQLVF